MKPLPDYPEALKRALEGVEPLGETETVDASAAVGRVLSRPVIADRPLPPIDRAQMDGYAVRSADLARGAALPVTGSIAAGQPAPTAVPAGKCVAIATGAPLPADLDAVIPHELSDRGNPVRFTIETIEPGHAIHRRGADAGSGDLLVPAGTILGARHLGIAATSGGCRLDVARRPRANVLTSGDEIRPADQVVADHQVRNANAPMIRQMLAAIGADPIAHVHVFDDLEATVDSVGRALERCDLLITVGGISAGDRDFIPAAFERHGVTASLSGAAIQPGRPITVGRSPGGVVVVGLPGNPVSVLACMCLFCWPIVRVMLGLAPTLGWRERRLAEGVMPNSRRRAFRPAILDADERARVPRWAGSGDLAHTAGTAGLLELPVQAEEVRPGSALRFLPWPS